jgi:hypothetical protein
MTSNAPPGTVEPDNVDRYLREQRVIRVNVPVYVEVDGCGCSTCDKDSDGIHGFIHLGTPRSTTPAERTVRSQRGPSFIGKATVLVDIAADKELPINGFTYTDEAGNPVPKPADAVEVFTSDDPAIVSVVVADDGQLVARSVALGGPVNVHGVSDWTDADGVAHQVTGDAALNVVAGGAERAEVSFGTAREITPDV